MRIVWASSHVPEPALGGGWVYEYEVLRHAAREHDVTLVSGELAPGEVPPAAVTDLGVTVVGAKVPQRELPASKFGWTKLLLTAHAPSGAWMFEPVRESMSTAVRDLEARSGVDLVQVFPQESAPIAAACASPTALLVGDSYTVQASRARAESHSINARIRLTLEERNAREWERRWYPRAGAVACVAPSDADALSGICGVEIGTVPLAVGDEWFEPIVAERDPSLVTLVGALDYVPNVDATLWFCTVIWPSVKRAWPRARLRVVGRRPVAEVRAAVAAAGGELLGDVPDVRPYYAEAAVAVAPIRLGSGVKNKVLHAAACRAPQVGTAFAFAETGAVDDRDVLMAEDADGIAEAVVCTLRDPQQAARRAASAYAIAQAHSRAATGAALDRLWERALASAPAQPSA